MKGIGKSIIYADLEVSEAGLGAPVRFVIGLFSRAGKASGAVKAEAQALATTAKAASGGARTLETGAQALVTRVAPRAGEFGYRSSAAEIARADQVLNFVRSSNGTRLGMNMKEAAAQFDAAVAEALKKFPGP
jgi:hypothetical protein